MVIIRIQTEETGAMDWNVELPENLTFEHILQAMSHAEPTLLVQAFDYIDEDQDKITVRTDEELKTMFYYFLSEQGKTLIQLWPKGTKKSEQRNIHGLKIQIRDEPAAAAMTDVEMESQTRKHSGDIQDILQSGELSDSDLQYLQVLGKGNAATVHKAFNKRTNKLTAVKIIFLDISHSIQRQIISELDILHKCHSPTIIDFYGVFFRDSRIFISAEYMDGGSLDRYGKIPEAILGRIAVAVAKGLQYLWSLKIMHRDVKPSNMLVNTSGQVKLCDFGVSVQLLDSIASTYVGTNAYMAPERIQGHAYSIHSDVWSFGISLYELATSIFPYASAQNETAKPMDFFRSLLEKDPPTLPQGTFSDAFINFVAQCMTKNPKDRPAPEALLNDPFIRQHNDGNTGLIAEWLLQMQKAAENASV